VDVRKLPTTCPSGPSRRQARKVGTDVHRRLPGAPPASSAQRHVNAAVASRERRPHGRAGRSPRPRRTRRPRHPTRRSHEGGSSVRSTPAPAPRSLALPTKRSVACGPRRRHAPGPRHASRSATPLVHAPRGAGAHEGERDTSVQPRARHAEGSEAGRKGGLS